MSSSSVLPCIEWVTQLTSFFCRCCFVFTLRFCLISRFLLLSLAAAVVVVVADYRYSLLHGLADNPDIPCHYFNRELFRAPRLGGLFHGHHHLKKTLTEIRHHFLSTSLFSSTMTSVSVFNPLSVRLTNGIASRPLVSCIYCQILVP